MKQSNFCECGEEAKKNGKLKSGGQRYRCFSCGNTFTLGGVRGTYTNDFKEKLARKYCHEKISARKLAKKYKVSTYSLVVWSKRHKKKCNKCKK